MVCLFGIEGCSDVLKLFPEYFITICSRFEILTETFKVLNGQRPSLIINFRLGKHLYI